MGAAVMGFAAGVLAGVMLAACGGGDDSERVTSCFPVVEDGEATDAGAGETAAGDSGAEDA